ncbi:hypothetical protein C4559_01395 [Candidatus Microgenomates bacterium]|nr:MAG: hypothetical protein C4559_01395 [Candidatus Microgenomates bacterium]
MIKAMKKLAATTISVLSFLGLATPAFADTSVALCPNASSQFNILCNLSFGNVGPIIGKLIIIVLILAIIISLFFLIYGGIKWITSGGDKTAVEGARNHIVAAIVGLIIALLAFFIINFIGGLFGIDITNLVIPTLVTR